MEYIRIFWSDICNIFYSKLQDFPDEDPSLTLNSKSWSNKYNKILQNYRKGYPAFSKTIQRCSLGKGVPKICSKFTGEQPCWSAILIKLKSNFTQLAFTCLKSTIETLQKGVKHAQS